MLQLPRTEEEAELAASFVGVSRMDMDDPTGIGADRVCDTAVPNEREHEVVEQCGLADADGKSHRPSIRRLGPRAARRPSSPLSQLVQYAAPGVESL